MKIKSFVPLTALALMFGMVVITATGQKRRTKRPTPKPPRQETQAKDDPNAITLLYSEDGRDYYLHEVVKKPETDELSYGYVVAFDQTTPAGRSGLSKMVVLAKLIAVDANQLDYVTAVEYECHFSLKEPTTVQYDDIFWIDRTGNTIVQLHVKLGDSADIKAQVAEVATYSEPYVQKLLDSAEDLNEARRRNVEANMRLAIDTGHEDQARRMKYEPSVPGYLPALSLVVAGGTKHMSEIQKAAKQAYDKKTRNAK